MPFMEQYEIWSWLNTSTTPIYWQISVAAQKVLKMRVLSHIYNYVQHICLRRILKTSANTATERSFRRHVRYFVALRKTWKDLSTILLSKYATEEVEKYLKSLSKITTKGAVDKDENDTDENKADIKPPLHLQEPVLPKFQSNTQLNF